MAEPEAKELKVMRSVPERGLVAALVVAAALGAMAVVGVVAWTHAGGSGSPRPWSKPPVVDSAVVRLTYVDSPCQNKATVTVEEDAKRVVLTVRTRTFAFSCSDANALYHIEARLDSPLGDRKLIDGACKIPQFVDDLDCMPGKPNN